MIAPKTKRALIPNAVGGTPTWHRYVESRKIRVKVPTLTDDKLDSKAVAAAFKTFNEERGEDESRAFSKLMTSLRNVDKGIEDDGDGVRDWNNEIAIGHFYQCETTKTERQWGADELPRASA